MMTLLPPWALEGGDSRALERLRDPADRRRIRDEVGREDEDWDNLLASTGWESVYVSSLGGGRNPDLEGRNLAQIAESRGEDPAGCMMDLLLEQEGRVSMIFFHMAEDDVGPGGNSPTPVLVQLPTEAFSRKLRCLELLPGPTG